METVVRKGRRFKKNAPVEIYITFYNISNRFAFYRRVSRLRLPEIS